jgi:hypothetical protein
MQQEKYCVCAELLGAIVEAPTDNSHVYQMQLTNGVVIHLKRHDLTIRKHF